MTALSPKRKNPVEVDDVLHFLPPALASAVDISEVSYGYNNEFVTTYDDETKVIEVRGDEDPPAWAMVHECLHNIYDVAPPWDVIEQWAEARGRYVDEARDHDLSDHAEEKWVQDMTSWLTGSRYRIIREETPVSEKVVEVFERKWGSAPEGK